MSAAERVRATRVRVKLLLRGLDGSRGHFPTHKDIDEALDAYAAAVRAETLAEVSGTVEWLRAEAFIAPAGTEFVRRTSTCGRQVIATNDLRAIFATLSKLESTG